jgi:hypothetical protein
MQQDIQQHQIGARFARQLKTVPASGCIQHIVPGGAKD